MKKSLQKLNNAYSLEELKDLLVDRSFNQKVLRQIEKDFAQLRIEIDIHNMEVIQQIQEQVDLLLISDQQRLMNLLYRIDINEKKIGELQMHDPTVPERDVITFLIIQRELQKVIFRELYKQ